VGAPATGSNPGFRVPPPGLSAQNASMAGRMLDAAKNVGRGVISPGGIATSLALASNEAGAGSDTVPGRSESVYDMEDRAGRDSRATSAVVDSWQADSDRVYASELALIQKKEAFQKADGRNKKAALQEYQAAKKEHDALVRQVQETDKKTGRGAVVEKLHLPAVAGGRLTPGQAIVPPVSPLVEQNIRPTALATTQPGASDAAQNKRELNRLPPPVPDTKLRDKAAESAGIDLQSLIPGYDPSEYEQNVKELREQTAAALKDRDVGKWMAFMDAGFAIAAGKSPNALTNIAVGAGLGIKEARAVQKEYSARNDLIQKQVREERRFERAYKLGNQKMVLDATLKIRDLESTIAYRTREGQIKTLEGLLVTAIRNGDTKQEAKIKQIMNNIAVATADAKNPLGPMLRDGMVGGAPKGVKVTPLQ
jgi:hypothetical protein